MKHSYSINIVLNVPLKCAMGLILVISLCTFGFATLLLLFGGESLLGELRGDGLFEAVVGEMLANPLSTLVQSAATAMISLAVLFMYPTTIERVTHQELRRQMPDMIRHAFEIALEEINSGNARYQEIEATAERLQDQYAKLSMKTAEAIAQIVLIQLSDMKHLDKKALQKLESNLTDLEASQKDLSEELAKITPRVEEITQRGDRLIVLGSENEETYQNLHAEVTKLSVALEDIAPEIIKNVHKLRPKPE